MRPIAIDIFSGAGGFSLGFEQAGFDVRCTFEPNLIDACTYAYNFPKCKIFTQPSSKLILQETGGTVDVVFGSLSCKGFSTMKLDDPENNTVKRFVRFVHEIKPRYFVIESSCELAKGKNSVFLEDVIEEELQSKGYDIQLPWRIMNAADCGVPQDRERLVVFGALKGFPLPEYPILPKDRLTCHDALNDLPDADSFPKLAESDEVYVRDTTPTSQYLRKIRCYQDDWSFGYPRKWDRSLMTASIRPRHPVEYVERCSKIPSGSFDRAIRVFRLASDSPARALNKSSPIHYKYPRITTVREMARLHSYPDWFRFHVTHATGSIQVSNSVPPMLAKVVASSVLQAMEIRPTRPEQIVSLGNISLLRVTRESDARLLLKKR